MLVSTFAFLPKGFIPKLDAPPASEVVDNNSKNVEMKLIRDVSGHDIPGNFDSYTDWHQLTIVWYGFEKKKVYVGLFGVFFLQKSLMLYHKLSY